MLTILANESATVQLQVTTWLQILAGIMSLIGTAIYVGSRIGRMETRLDSHLSTIEQIGTHVSKEFSDQERQIHDLNKSVQQHEIRLTGIDISIGHLEQQIAAVSK